METKPKKKLFKKWWFWLIVIIVIGAIGSMNNEEPKKVGENQTVAANSAKTDDKKTEETKTEETKTEETKKEEPKGPQIFKVGDIIELKDFKFTVNKVYTVEGNEFAQPQDGNEFVAIDCTVENISNEEKGISSIMMFKVVDKDGRACEYSLLGQTAAKAGQLDGTVGVGRKLTGVYVVEVPKGKTGLELEFNGSLFTGSQVIIDLN